MTKEQFKNRVTTLKHVIKCANGNCDWLHESEAESFLKEIYDEAYKLGYSKGYDDGCPYEMSEDNYDSTVEFE